MGWLRDHSAKKVAALREWALGPFDDVPTIPREVWECEQAEWHQWQQDLERNRRYLVALALSELAIRGCVARRGRKSTLDAYKVYKRQFLSKWASAVERNAKLKGLSTEAKNALSLQDKHEGFQHQVAVTLGFTKASELRALKRAAKERDGMLWSRYPDFIRRMVKQGWHRHGNITHVWMLQSLMSPREFEECAATLVPQ